MNINAFFRSIRSGVLASLLVGVFFSQGLLAQTAGSVSLTATLADTGAGPDHWTVVWVTDATTGAYVRTLRRQGDEPRGSHWNRHCSSWYAAAGLATSATNFTPALDGFTGATATSYAPPDSPFTQTWNCKDASGLTVPDGTYKLWIQYSDDSGVMGPVTTGGLLWTKGPSASTVNPANQGTNFTGMKIVWTPTVTALPVIAVEQPAGTGLVSGTSTVNFGSSTVGTAASLSFTIKNTGTALLSGIVLSKDGTNSADFTVTASPAASVAAAGSTTFTVSFNPSAAGARTAALHIASNDAAHNPFNIALSGTGTAVVALPVIAVEQPAGTGLVSGTGTVGFGSSTVGTAASLSFTIKNTGSALLSGIVLSKDGTNSADFTVTASPAASVAALGSTTFTVAFNPSAVGSRTAALHIASNDAAHSPFNIALSGTGTAVAAPVIVVEQPAGTGLVSGTSTVNFGSSTVGTAASLSFTIKNTGTALLSGIVLSKDGTNSADFTVTASPAASVAAAGSTTFTVAFNPSAVGSRTAALHIASNDAAHSPFNIALSGTGTAVAAPVIAVEQPAGTGLVSGTSTVNFGSSTVGTAASLSFTIKNTGSALLSGIVLSKDGTNSADFTVTASPAASVAALGSTTFTVAFNPSAVGSRTAALHIASNDAAHSPFDIALSGTGTAVAAPVIAVEQPAGTGLVSGTSTVNFGSSTVGTAASLSFTIKNTGSAGLTGVLITKDGTNSADFTVTASPAASVAALGSTTFTVAFNPSAVGSRTAALHIASNDAAHNPFDIALSGTGTAVPGGIAPDIAVEQPARTPVATGDTRNFPMVDPSKKATLTFVVRNTVLGRNLGSSAYLRITRIALSGPNASEFRVSKSSIKSIKPGKSDTFKVDFAPRSEGRKNALLTLISNDPDETPYLIELRASTPHSDESEDESEDESDHESASRVATTSGAAQVSGVNALMPAGPLDPSAGPVQIKLWMYALSGDPAAAAAADASAEQVTVTVEGVNYAALAFRQLKSADMLAYVVEESTDMNHWQPLSLPWQWVGAAIDAGDGTEWVTVRSKDPLDAENPRFMRLRVEVLP